MKKSIFYICLLCLAIILSACPNKKDKAKPPNIEEITTLDQIANEFDSDYGDNTQNTPQTSMVTTPQTLAKPNTTPTTPTKPPVTSTKPATNHSNETPVPGEFTVQFMSLRDRTRVEEVRRILTSAAYFCEIQEVEINDEKMYRLRLAGSYSRSYALYLAEKIKKEIAEIDDYWVTKK